MDAKVAVLGAGIATLEATIDAKVASLAAAIQEISVQLKTLMSFLPRNTPT
jgi:thioredoxin reductase